jgi:hypothetical protein
LAKTVVASSWNSVPTASCPFATLDARIKATTRVGVTKMLDTSIFSLHSLGKSYIGWKLPMIVVTSLKEKCGSETISRSIALLLPPSSGQLLDCAPISTGCRRGMLIRSCSTCIHGTANGKTSYPSWSLVIRSAQNMKRRHSWWISILRWCSVLVCTGTKP